MITREQLEKALGDDKNPFKNKEDHDVKAITLLRSKIPYDICHSIIGGAEHDVLYLCDVEKVLLYLEDTDIEVLADCNVWIDEDNDSLALFV